MKDNSAKEAEFTFAGIRIELTFGWNALKEKNELSLNKSNSVTMLFAKLGKCCFV